MSVISQRFKVLQRPILTEKTARGIEYQNAYVFQVHPTANKIQSKQAVEENFEVKVVKVNTRWKRGKFKRVGRTYGRTSAFKEAVVTLQRGDKIDVY